MNTRRELPESPYLAAVTGRKPNRVPVWFMRQAGRSLPEYRALRERHTMLAACFEPEVVCEITLQPIRRFGFDGAILFSDILIVPYAMGQRLEFLAGEGPSLSPRLAEAALDGLVANPSLLAPIYETVAKVRAQLGPETTLPLGMLKRSPSSRAVPPMTTFLSLSLPSVASSPRRTST